MQRVAPKRRRESDDNGEGLAAAAPAAAATTELLAVETAGPSGAGANAQLSAVAASAEPPAGVVSAGPAAAAAVPELPAVPTRPFDCPICFERCVLPVVPLCGVHTFCQACIVAHCKDNASPLCPCCRAPIQKKFVVHPGIQDAIWQLADSDKLALAMRAGFSPPSATAAPGALAAKAPNQAAWAKLCGLGVSYDLPGAASLLRAAADAGHPPSAATLAYMLIFSIGVKRDVLAAKELLRAAAAAGDAFSAAALGGFERSQQSIDALQKLADDGSTAAGVMFSSAAPHSPHRSRVLQMAAILGDPFAMYFLGRRRFDDSSAGSSDRDRALDLISKAASAGLAAAQHFLGRHLLSSRSPDAVPWLKKSAAQQNAEGMNLLGYCFLFGAGVAQDRSLAVKWLSGAADEGSADANFTLGEMWERGFAGCPVNLGEAFRRYRLASSARVPLSKAQLRLGQLLESGKGCPKDLSSALSTYQAAASAGSAEAKVAVTRVKILLAIRSLEATFSGGATPEERGAALHSLRAINVASQQAGLLPVPVVVDDEEEGDDEEEDGGGGGSLEDTGEDDEEGEEEEDDEDSEEEEDYDEEDDEEENGDGA